MENASYVALSRQATLRREMDLVANNLANMNTTAYKGESMLFVEHLRDTDSDLGDIAFVQDLGVVRDLDEGGMHATGNPLDLAISGDGYFSVETEAGEERYTRDGSFHLDRDGRIVNSSGMPVLDRNGQPVTLPPRTETIEVSRDGTVSTETGVVGRLRVTAFENQQALRKEAGKLFVAGGDANAAPADEAVVQQGMLEGSNVQGVVEMTRMMDLVRSYQMANQLSQSEHERQRRAIQSLVPSPA
jgi:flagellar basal-body rod protein FlgF